MTASERSDFTQGSILSKLVYFMLPILGALALQSAYGAVDLLVVGRFGTTEGLSAVSTGSQVLNLATFVVSALATGVTILIARYLGEKRPQFIAPVIGGAAFVFTILSIILAIIMVCLSRQISVLMQAPAEAVILTSSYVRICGGGIFFIVAYNLLSAIFRDICFFQESLHSMIGVAHQAMYAFAEAAYSLSSPTTCSLLSSEDSVIPNHL